MDAKLLKRVTRITFHLPNIRHIHYHYPKFHQYVAYSVVSKYQRQIVHPIIMHNYRKSLSNVKD